MPNEVENLQSSDEKTRSLTDVGFIDIHFGLRFEDESNLPEPCRGEIRIYDSRTGKVTAYCNVQSYRNVFSFPVEKLPIRVDIVIPGFLGASATLRNRINHIPLSPVSVRSIILGGLPSQLHEVTAKLIVSPVTNFGEGDRWTQIIDVSSGTTDFAPLKYGIHEAVLVLTRRTVSPQGRTRERVISLEQHAMRLDVLEGSTEAIDLKIDSQRVAAMIKELMKD